MASRTVIDGNAFYEIDEECMRRREEERKKVEMDYRKMWPHVQSADIAVNQMKNNRQRT